MKRILLAFNIFFSCSNLLYPQINIDGNITEASWGNPLATSSAGPVPGFGAGNEINSLYATSLGAGDIYLALGGNVQYGKHIMVFIDSRPGGYSTGNFEKIAAPAGLDHFNSATSFDGGFLPDYCLVIGTNLNHDDFFFDLYSLSGGNSANKRLGDISNPDLGASPANNSNTQGFEIKLTTSTDGIGTDIQYSGGDIKLMAMYISDNGILSNQFISKAKTGEGNYGSGAIIFSNATPNPVSFNPNRILPVQFLQVDSHIIEDHSFIQWSVADDIEIDHYELEESNNGSVFHILKNIPAKQNNFKTDYKEEDDNLNIGNNFYRVKAVSTNGTIIYSKILKMPYGMIDNTLFVYPNPVKDLLQIQLHGLSKGKYKLHIYNDGGQEIYNRYVTHDGIDKTITVQLPSTLQKGIYRLLFINKFEFYKQNFSIQ
jgi:hypothetical protein